MPALTDKIFLPISIFVLNIVLAAFKFVLANAVGACFAIYAMRGCEYAKSVGWIRSAGYCEMIETSYSTFRRKNGISSLVTPSFRLGQPKEEVVISPQVKLISMFFGWSFIVPINGSVVGTMERALNSPIANPSPDNGYVYSPVTSEYTPVCTDFGLHFQGEIMRNGTGCVVEIGFPSTSNGPSIKTERSPNRWSTTVATNPERPNLLINDQPALGLLYFLDTNSSSIKEDDACIFAENYQESYGYPRTSIAKHVYGNGDIAVVAMTTTRFNGLVAAYDSVAANTFSTYHSDDLLLTMNETIRTKTILAPSGQELNNLMAEILVANSTVEAFVCTIFPQSFSGDGFSCVYITMTMHVFNQPVHNAIIQGVIERLKRVLSPNYYMVLEYFPEITKDNTDAPISTKKLRNDTVVMADYMAKVGSSFFADFHEGKVYILYDKAEIEVGLEIPLWVLIAAGVITLVSLCVWQLTHWLVGPPHTSSLYSITRTRLAERSGTPVPRLMRFKSPLMFEDVDLLPDQVEHLSDETGTLPEDIKSE